MESNHHKGHAGHGLVHCMPLLRVQALADSRAGQVRGKRVVAID